MFCFHINVQECLSEQIQILQGKISVLEDELSKVSVQLQEKGEVLGPVMEVGIGLILISLIMKTQSYKHYLFFYFRWICVHIWVQQ